MNRQKIINDVFAHHPVLGELCREAEDSYDSYNYNAALACLFVMAEASLKYALDYEKTDNMGFFQVIGKAKSKGVISKAESQTFHQLRDIRNNLFHDDPYSFALPLNGLLYPYSESDTRKLVYEMFADKVFEVSLRVVQGSSV